MNGACRVHLRADLETLGRALLTCGPLTGSSTSNAKAKFEQNASSRCKLPANCRPFIESNNKGPHFWDEDHPIRWYTDIYDPVAKAVEAGAAGAAGPLAVDGSSNTFTVSGVNVLGKPSPNVRSPRRRTPQKRLQRLAASRNARVAASAHCTNSEIL
jgi:hypothetical protein